MLLTTPSACGLNQIQPEAHRDKKAAAIQLLLQAGLFPPSTRPHFKQESLCFVDKSCLLRGRIAKKESPPSSSPLECWPPKILVCRQAVADCALGVPLGLSPKKAVAYKDTRKAWPSRYLH